MADGEVSNDDPPPGSAGPTLQFGVEPPQLVRLAAALGLLGAPLNGSVHAELRILNYG